MYFVTILRVLDAIVDDCRTVGYYKSYRDAYDCCIQNWNDIFEGRFYQYAVITFVPEGLYPNKSEQQWFFKDKEGKINLLEQYKKPDAIGKYEPYIIG